LTSVLVVPHRPPILAAKMLATIDALANGRLVLGAGAGWMAGIAALRQASEAASRDPLRSKLRCSCKAHSSGSRTGPRMVRLAAYSAAARQTWRPTPPSRRPSACGT
jgi:hypothetical protein